MNLIVLSKRAHGDVIPAVAVEGHIISTTSVHLEQSALDALIMSYEGEWFYLAMNVMMRPIMTFMEALKGVDIAPYVRFKHVGTERTPKGYLMQVVAWEFDSKKSKRRSELPPPSPTPFYKREKGG